MSDFKSKNVLITGAASGIGKMMAEKAASLGANLFLWDVNQDGLDAVSMALQQNGSNVHTYVVDLSDRTAIQHAAASVLNDCGAIDILINNAGVVSGKPLLEISDEQIQRTFDVNTLALFWTTRAFLPGMIEQGRGHIVTIASAGGIVGTSRLVDYSSSKFAAVGFDDALRMELKRLKLPIKTTVVCPFYIDTGMFDGVKTRFPFILPILKPEYAVRRIIKAIQGNRRRLVMPRFVMTSYPMRIFPMAIFDAVIGFFGINKTMDEFTGRAHSNKKEKIPA